MSLAHVLYLLFTILIFVTLLRHKDITIICVLSMLVVSFVYTGNIAVTITSVCKAVIVGFTDLLPIFIGISMIISMTYVLRECGGNSVLSGSFLKGRKNPYAIYLIIGCIMFLVSMFIWPSPAVVLMGSMLIPIAKKTGLPAVLLASSINIFGHGMALSGDFFIQGVPAIVAGGAGFESKDIYPYLVPLWSIMCITVLLVSLFMIRLQIKKKKYAPVIMDEKIEESDIKNPKKAKISVAVAIVLLLTAVVLVFKLELTGDDATNFIAGTALIIACILCVINYSLREAPDKVVGYVVDGFSFTMKIFAPALLIVAFFSLGNQDGATAIFGDGATGFLADTVSYLVKNIHLPEVVLALFTSIISFIYSVDGSGFSGLMVIGDIAGALTDTTEHVKILTSLGQLNIIWIAGGTLIPWSVIPVASVCGVSPGEIVKQNFIPVVVGLLVTTISAGIMLMIF